MSRPVAQRILNAASSAAISRSAVSVLIRSNTGSKSPISENPVPSIRGRLRNGTIGIIVPNGLSISLSIVHFADIMKSGSDPGSGIATVYGADRPMMPSG